MAPLIAAQLLLLAADDEAATVDAEKCAFCYSCYRACKHNALAPNEDNSAMACLSAACFACGTCAAICPGQAISLTELQVAKIFACENAAAPPNASLVPCGGGLGVDILAKASARHGKITLITCMDDACRHFVGGKRACQQARRLSENISTIKASPAMKEELF